MSITQRTAKRAPEPASDLFRLVYASSKKPTTRHLDKRCWSTAEYRDATREELDALPVCKHCKRRAILDAAKAAAEQAQKGQVTS